LGQDSRFQRFAQWHPAIADSRIENNQASDRVGCVRYFHLRDGGLIRERLLALSDYDFTCTLQHFGKPYGVDNYVATIKLTPVTDGGRCFAEWSAEFDCPPNANQSCPNRLVKGFFKLDLTH
jgi:hypothetical protein